MHPSDLPLTTPQQMQSSTTSAPRSGPVIPPVPVPGVVPGSGAGAGAGRAGFDINRGHVIGIGSGKERRTEKDTSMTPGRRSTMSPISREDVEVTASLDGSMLK